MCYNKIIGEEIMRLKNKILISISTLLLIIYIGLVISGNLYYNKHVSILECVHIIGPVCECVCIYQEGQEKIILLYKILMISSYIMIFINLLFNVYFLITKKEKSILNILPIVSTIIFIVISIIFFVILFSK